MRGLWYVFPDTLSSRTTQRNENEALLLNEVPGWQRHVEKRRQRSYTINLDTRRMRMASFRPRLLYPEGKSKNTTVQDRQLTKETSGDNVQEKGK